METPIFLRLCPSAYPTKHTYIGVSTKVPTYIKTRYNPCIGYNPSLCMFLIFNVDCLKGECDLNPRCAGRAPCQGVYSGSRPFSEPETIAVANFLLQHKDRMKMYLSLHSYSQLWLIPWAYTRQHPTDYDQLVRISLRIVVCSTVYPYGTAVSAPLPL